MGTHSGQAAGVIHLKFLGDPAPQGSKVQTRWGALREVSKKLDSGVHRFNTLANSSFEANRLRSRLLRRDFYSPASEEPLRNWSNANKLKDSAPQHHTKTPDLDKLLRGLLDPLTVRCGAMCS